MSPSPLAYVVKMFPRFSETFVVNELLELERRGVPVLVYSLKRPPVGPRHAMLSRLKAEVVYLPESPWRAAGAVAGAHASLFRRAPETWLRVLWYVVTRKNWPAMKRFLQAGVLVRNAEARGVRHLHAHFATSATRVSMLAARLSPLTYSFTAHAKDIYLDGQDVDLLRDKIMEARFVITVSEYNREHLRSLCGEAAASRVMRLYNGVDLEALRRSGAARRPGSILCVARLVEKKGVADLLFACSLLHHEAVPFQCRIAGDGPLRGALEQQARELGIAGQVTFLGALRHQQVVEELRTAEVFALPCVIAADGNRDGLPTVILEAMACGTPVVSTRVTGVPEMIEDGVSGRVLQPGRPEELAAALRQLLEDAPLRESMGGAGRRLAEDRFSLRRNVGELSLHLMAALTGQDQSADSRARPGGSAGAASGNSRRAGGEPGAPLARASGAEAAGGRETSVR